MKDVDEFFEVTIEPLDKSDYGIKVGELVEYLKRFPNNAEVWIGTRDGLSNEAVYACRLDYHDVIIEPRQDK